MQMPMMMMPYPQPIAPVRSRRSGGSNKYKRKYTKVAKTLKRMRKVRKRAKEAFSVLYPQGTGESETFYGKKWKDADPSQRIMRQVMGYKGDGDYYNDHFKPWAKKWIPKGSFATAGTALGQLAGPYAPFASMVGGALGTAASNYLGYGDYGPTSTNSIMAGGSPPDQQVISVNSGGDLSGDITITHSEFIQNVTVTAAAQGTTPFTVNSFAINPALASTFPFLSQLAENFTLYEFHGLMFQYKPTSGEFGSAGSNSLGKVIFATNYDPDAAVFTSSPQMENYDYANSTKPSCGMVHGIETKSGHRATDQLYTRTGTSSKDKVFTDIGLFQMATDGIYANAAGTQVIGELWVTYSVKLSRKNLVNTIGLSVPYFFQAITATTTTTWTDTTTVTSGARTSSLAPYNATLSTATPVAIVGGLSVINNFAIRFTFPQNIIAGTYMVTVWMFRGTTPLAATPNVYNLLNCSYSPWTTGNVQIASTTLTGQSVVHKLINVNSPGSTQASIDIGNSLAVVAGDIIYVELLQCSPLLSNA